MNTYVVHLGVNVICAFTERLVLMFCFYYIPAPHSTGVVASLII